MGSTPAWLTIVVAILGPAATLAAQWVAGVRALRLALVERDNRRDERVDQRREDARRLREESYAEFLAAARTMRSTGSGAARSADGRTALAVLRDTASYIELRAPTIADGPLARALDAAERLIVLRSNNDAFTQVVAEAEAEFDGAIATLRTAMRMDVAGANDLADESS